MTAPPRLLIERAMLISLIAIVTGLAVVLLAVLMARYWWAFELATHFRMHYLFVAALGLVLALWLRNPVLGVAVVILALPHTVALTSLALPGAAQAAPSQTAGVIRVMTVNAFWKNWDHQALASHVARTDPDILVIQEAGRHWRPTLLQIGAEFPHSVPENWQTAHDVIVFSRFPVASSVDRLPTDQGFHSRTADLEIDGRLVTVLGVHTASPVSASYAESRNRYLAAIADMAAAVDHPLIVAGDFNSTIWSPHFVDLMARSGLQNAATGRGWQPTWPVWLSAAGIAIDHVLVSDHFATHGLIRGPKVGSDHYPLTADLALR